LGFEADGGALDRQEKDIPSLPSRMSALDLDRVRIEWLRRPQSRHHGGKPSMIVAWLAASQSRD
jgi:hypothetical protein